MIPLMLLLARTAGAHVVHDDVGGLAVPDDFESAGRAWVLLHVDRGERGRTWDILQTLDGGRSWDPVPPPSLPGDPRSMSAWDGAPVLGLDDGGLLVLDGADWRSLEGPGATPLALDGSGTVLASASTAGLHVRSSTAEA